MPLLIDDAAELRERGDDLVHGFGRIGDGGGNAQPELLEDACDRGEHDLLLVREVLVQQSDTDPTGLRDRLHGHRVGALLLHQTHGGIDDLPLPEFRAGAADDRVEVFGFS